MSHTLLVLARALLAAVGCGLCALGIGGPLVVTVAGSLLLLVALSLPHALAARRLARSRDGLAGLQAAVTAVGTACPSALFYSLRFQGDLLTGVVLAVFAGALVLGVAVAAEVPVTDARAGSTGGG